MSERPAAERLGEYVAVLRGIGLTERAILDVHTDDPRGGSLETVLQAELPGTAPDQLNAALGDAIASSARGIDAPAEYWNHAPEVHLDQLLAPYGCTVAIEPTKRADTLAEGKLVVRLTDAAGNEYWTRFEYPDSDLGEDNYPALIDHVQRQLLSTAGLRIVRLVSPSRRWRFAMMSDRQLAALQERYGDRLTIFGAPLLANDQPPAFASEDPPIPEWYEISEVEPSPDAEIAIDVPETESLDDLEPTDAELEFDDVGESPESIIESVEQSDAGSGQTASATAGEVEASDDQVEEVFGDLSDVSLEPQEPDPETAPGADGGETLAIDGGSTAATDADDPMDSLFDEMKQDIVDSEPETGENADAGKGVNVADLVESVEESPSGGREPNDVPQDAADLTASELFSSLDER